MWCIQTNRKYTRTSKHKNTLTPTDGHGACLLVVGDAAVDDGFLAGVDDDER